MRKSLTDEQAQEIRAKHKSGTKQVDLAREYGVHKRTISKIVNSDTYKAPGTFITGEVSWEGVGVGLRRTTLYSEYNKAQSKDKADSFWMDLMEPCPITPEMVKARFGVLYDDSHYEAIANDYRACDDLGKLKLFNYFQTHRTCGFAVGNKNQENQ